MASVQQEVAANKPTNRKQPGLETDEQDNVADYIEAGLLTRDIETSTCLLLPWRRLLLDRCSLAKLKPLLSNQWARCCRAVFA